ncbi:hypothetical protein KUV85_00530 [Nocardioides panacisoli]|uniref:hypothetical protein n=1 Tax=Nocardioides panacisoli TaxID=627624 RepID=UPI001C63595C|nr:hypothetical protein [Nocardioides panacisoli]QYJ04199.1 hypothetical protein KUV85_00530 [Nocardioides panacisoli]
MKWPAAGVLALGLALSACSSDGVPQTGGVAAEVADQTITLEDVDVLTDALCTSNAATGDARYTRPRSQMQGDVLGALTQAAIADELGLAGSVEDPVDTDQVPGWAEMTEDEQRELAEFLDADARLRAVLQEIGDPDEADPQAAAQSGLGELARRSTEAGIDVTVNPRFGITVEDGAITGAGDLSTPVGVEATRGQELSPDYLASLPEAQLCGARPEAGVAG